MIFALLSGQKRKCLVSGYPTDPNILGPTQTFLKTFGILKSNFGLFIRIFILFPYKKVFIKKKVCLPTDPKNFGHVTGNKTYFSFGLSASFLSTLCLLQIYVNMPLGSLLIYIHTFFQEPIRCQAIWIQIRPGPELSMKFSLRIYKC